MWSKTAMLMLGASMVFCGSASAATINGTYAFRLTVNCQATLKLFKDSSGKVTDISATQPGMMQENIGTAVFNSATGKVTITGISVWGDLIRISGKASTAMHQETLSVNWNYSNTASTLTLNGDVYRAEYTNVVGGIPYGAYFERRDTNCAVSGSAIRK